MTDTVTILEHSTIRLCKLWRADGTISSYEDAKNYVAHTRSVGDIHALSRLLTKLERQPHCAVIRGAPNAYVDPEAAPGKRRKVKAAYDDVPHHWVLIDVDSTDLEPDAFIAEHLPEFDGYSYHWQLSNSTGHPSKAGKLSYHLWFWLAAPRTSDELRAWAPHAVDKSVLNSVQFHYTAAPVFEAGVVDPVGRRSGFTDGVLGDEVVVDIARRYAAPAIVGPTDDNAAWLMSLNPTLGWSLQDARDVLMRCDASADREHWRSALMALHHELDGSDEGLDLADEWSATGASYAGREDVEGRWRSFGKGSGKITGKWLQKWAGECDTAGRYVAVDDYVARIKATDDEFTLREKVCADIAKDDRIDTMGREALAQTLAQAFRGMGQKVKYPLSMVRGLIAPPRPDGGRVAHGGEADRLPEWAQGWIWVTEEDKFFRTDSEQRVTKTSFDAMYNRLQSRDQNGAITANASAVALDDLGIETVTRAVYMPWGGPKFTMHGVDCINTYRPSSVPQAVDRLSAAGERAVQLVEDHLSLLCNGRAEVSQILTSWLAHNVQQPGVKVRWAPLIKGVEGDGKSLLHELLANVMGRPNVKSVSPKVLATDFSGWAEGSCVATLEELKMTGHNRHDVLNALKPYITNGSIEIHRKGRDPYEGVNTTNYIGFTNFNDALPIGDTDRRWFVVFTPWQHKDEMAQRVGGDLGGYFDRLVEAIRSQPAELRRWFLDYQIPESFKPNGNAPHTVEKAEMVGLSANDDDDVLAGIIEQGGEGVSAEVLTTTSLQRAIAFSGSDLKLQTSAMSKALNRLGWSKAPDQIKWQGRTHRVWTKGAILRNSTSLRNLLEKTLQKSADDLNPIT